MRSLPDLSRSLIKAALRGHHETMGRNSSKALREWIIAFGASVAPDRHLSPKLRAFVDRLTGAEA